MVKHIAKVVLGEDLYRLKDAEARSTLDTHASNTNIHVSAAEKEYWNSKVNPPSYSAPTAKTLTYTGSAQDLLNAGSAASGTIQYSSDGTNWSTSIPQAVNANTYTVYWRFIGSESTYVDSTAISVTIAKVTPTVTSPSANILTYNGEAQNLVTAGSADFGTLQYSIDDENWSTTVSSATNAGNYTVYYKVVGDSNINDVAQASINCSIAKVTPTVTAPTPKTLTYNTQSQELANAGSTDWGTIQYSSSENGTYSSSIPSETNANVTYKVWYKVVGDSNINGVGAASIDCMIAEKRVTTPTITLSQNSFVYTGTAFQPTVTVEDSGTTVDPSEYTVEYLNNTNVGTATIVIVDKTAGNYYIEGTTTFSITKATPTYTAPVATNPTYTGNTQNLLTSGSTSDGTIQYSSDNDNWSTTIPQETDADSYTIYWKLVGDANHTDIASTSVSCTISKAVPTYIPPTAKSITYSGSAQDLVNAGSTSHGTIQYSSDGSTWDTTIPQGTNADDYVVYWRLVGDSNHTDVTSTTINVSIAKANPTYVTPTAKTLTYNANAQELLNAGSTSDGTISYSEDGENWSNSVPSKTNAGDYIVYWKLMGDSNHNDVASTLINISIAKVTPTIVAPTAKTGLTYNTQAQELLNAGSTNWGTLKYSSDGTTYGTTIPSETNAGTYTLYYKVEGDGNVNNTTPVEINVTIAKADPTYTAPTAKSLTPTGSAQELVNAGVSSDGTFNYSLDNETWSTSIPQGTNAGNYTVYWKLVGDSNHNDVASTFITVVIGNITEPTAKSGLVYNGSSQELVNAGSSDFGTLQYSLDNENWGTSIPGGTNAGSYTVYWRVTYDGNVITSASISCSIAKANRVASFFDANGHDYVEINGVKWATKNVGANSQTDIGDYYKWGAGTTKYSEDTSTSCYQGLDETMDLSVDTARLIMGGSWRIPTDTEFLSLANCSYQYTTINNVSGGKFTDSQGNWIFLPGGGAYNQGTYENAGKLRYWTSFGDNFVSDSKYWANNFRCDDSQTPTITSIYRYYGYLIRGVINQEKHLLLAGETDTIEVHTTGNPTITLSSGNTSVATVSGMTVTAVGNGTTIITATIDGGINFNTTSISYSLEVYGGNKLVDLGLPSGTKWATGNIIKNGSSYTIGGIYDSGAYASWGNVTPHFTNGTTFTDGYGFTGSLYDSTPGSSLRSSSYPNKDAVYSATSGYDIARTLLGSPWRMPTTNNFIELNNNCLSNRYFKGNLFIVEFISKINGKKLIFGAFGYGNENKLNSYGTYGRYLTSSLRSYSSSNSRYGAYNFVFGTASFQMDSGQYKSNGVTVRAVQ